MFASSNDRFSTVVKVRNEIADPKTVPKWTVMKDSVIGAKGDGWWW